MPALNAQSAILDICREFSESRPNRKVVPSTPRLSFWTVLFTDILVPRAYDLFCQQQQQQALFVSGGIVGLWYQPLPDVVNFHDIRLRMLDAI